MYYIICAVYHNGHHFRLGQRPPWGGALSAAERTRLERLAFAVVAALFEWLFGCLGAHHG